MTKYNRGGLDELCDKPRPGQPTRFPRNREEEFRRRLDQVQNEHPGRRLEVWFQDEARVGRQGTFLPLPPYSPELNTVENLWHYFRSRYWSNRTYDNYDDRRHVALEAW
jgi:transposase